VKVIHIITIGKLKDADLVRLENNYLKRIQNPSIQFHEVKSHSENLDKEAQEVELKLKQFQNPYTIVLAESGELRDSINFSKWLSQLIEQHRGELVFIFGGAAGHGKKVLELARESISLSPLTFPHQLARLTLVEQLYRAQTIANNHPYHK